MEFINLSKEDIPDFKQFLADPLVKILKYIPSVYSEETPPKQLSITLNTNQTFIMDYNVYKTIFKKESKYDNDLIFGKDKTERIVSVEIDNDKLVIFKETENSVIKEERPNYFWLITHDKVSSKQTELLGNQHYKWLGKFDKLTDYLKAKNAVYNNDHYKINDGKEAALVFNGITYFKGMNVSDVSVLSFDIESDGLARHDKSEIYLITNSYRKNNRLVRKTFRLDEYESQGKMLVSWADWVREANPSILLGHNVLSYDIPYILHVAQLHGVEVCLGRNNAPPEIARFVSKFRKDGSQSYDFNNIFIYGREIVDTMFLSIKYDVARNFESYGLKAVIKHLGLEKEGRSFVDAGSIKQYYNNRHNNPEMWDKTVQYAEEDADDSLKIFDVMAPSYFYFTQSVSKTFQQMINQATGSQINNMMVRGYFQEGKSIAKADESGAFEGAISFGIPGLYKNVFKLDVASLYPSVVLQYQIYNKEKDPEKKFLQIMQIFTEERLKNKALAAETKDLYYKDLEQSQKIVINSGYGFLGTPGLNYNYPKGAGLVTKYGRDILNKGVELATGKNAEAWKGTDEELEESEDE